jgi:DNA-binding GntR family transcriptional regulator
MHLLRSLWRSAINEHRAIAAAVAKKDVEGASQLMSAHILGAGRSLVEFLQQQRGETAAASASVVK